MNSVDGIVLTGHEINTLVGNAYGANLDDVIVMRLGGTQTNRIHSVPLSDTPWLLRWRDAFVMIGEIIPYIWTDEDSEPDQLLSILAGDDTGYESHCAIGTLSTGIFHAIRQFISAKTSENGMIVWHLKVWDEPEKVCEAVVVAPTLSDATTLLYGIWGINGDMEFDPSPIGRGYGKPRIVMTNWDIE